MGNRSKLLNTIDVSVSYLGQEYKVFKFSYENGYYFKCKDIGYPHIQADYSTPRQAHIGARKWIGKHGQ